MNHWFLVGRDIMWFCAALTPLVGAAHSIMDNDAVLMFFCVLFQFTGIALLYFGVIR